MTAFVFSLQWVRPLIRRGMLAAGIAALLVASPALAQRYTVQEAGLDGGGGRVSSGELTLTSSVGGASPVGTVSAGRYVLYSGMPTPFAGQAAILVFHDPADDGETAERGTDRTVTARIVTNNAPLDAATLHYRSGDSQATTSVEMNEDESGFVATIPGPEIDESGLIYFFTVTDQQGTTVRAPRRGVYSLPVRLDASGIQKPEPLSGGTSQSAYRLLSMPVVPDEASPEEVLGDDVPALASASAYDPSEARFFEPIGTRVAEFPGTGDFELGRAFWLIVRNEVEEIDSGPGSAPALNEPVEIELSQGWNFIGTPFTVEVPTDNLQTSDGADLTLRSYGEDGYNTPDDPVTMMTPFEGYAVFVEEATTLTVDPPLPDSERTKQAAEAAALADSLSSFPWRLRIRGTGPAGRDADNVAAVHPDAADGWDARDWLAPPAVVSGLEVAFDPPEGAPEDVPLSADVRAEFTRGTTWPLTVRTDTAGAVRLSVEGVEQVPAQFEVRLLDETTKETWNLRASPQARLDVLSDGETRSMQLIVGTNAYVQERLEDLEALPSKYVLDPPYPNPSAGPVAFQVGVPETERVTVEVYNVLGQRVATIKDDESMSAGFHTVMWEAPHLASGMYFVRMEAGSFRQTQKLVRVR